MWEQRRDRTYEAIRPLGQDTVLVTSGFTTYRSLDGGRSFADVHGGGEREVGGQTFAENARGDLFVATVIGAARSTDRGATWTDAGLGTTWSRWGWTVLPLPDSVAAGRVLVGGLNGVSFADAAEWTLRPSALWERTRYGIEGLVVVGRPGGGSRVVAVGVDSSRPYRRVWVSDDAGATWAERGTLPDIEDGGVPGMGGLVALGGPSAAVVLGRGTVYRTDDGGDTWAVVGRAPVRDGDVSAFAKSAVVGPDGRLYVGVVRTGPAFDGAWVYRTTAPVVVAAEPAPEPDGVRVTVRPNPLSSGATVSVVLAAAASVTATVYDALGRRVAVLADGPMGSGRHDLPFDGRALVPGVYVVRVVASGVAAEARVTVAR